MLILGRFSKLFNILGQIMAFLTVILIGVLYLNQVLPVQFLSADTVATMEIIREYAILITLIVCGMEFACKRSIIIFIPFCALAALAFALSFPALF